MQAAVNDLPTAALADDLVAHPFTSGPHLGTAMLASRRSQKRFGVQMARARLSNWLRVALVVDGGNCDAKMHWLQTRRSCIAARFDK